MHRALLKLLVWTVCERWARCQQAFDAQFSPQGVNGEPTLTAADKALLHDANTRLNTIATLWTKEPAIGEFLFEDSAAEPSRIQGFLEQSVYGPYRLLSDLTPLLLHGASQQHTRRQIPAELPLLWNDVLDAEAQQQLGYRSLMWVNEGEHRSWTAAGSGLQDIPALSNHMIIERMSVLDETSPLGWVSTLRGAAVRWAAQQIERSELVVTPGKSSFISQFRGATQAQRDYGLRLMAEAALLIWVGPTWYLQSLIHGMMGKSAEWLQLVEPSLFFGLGFTNLLEPSIVKLHESVERYRPVLKPMMAEANGAELPLLTHDDCQQLWETVDSLIPEEQRFTARHLERSQALVPTMANRLLIAARPLYPTDSVRERLEALYDPAVKLADGSSGVPSKDAVYAALNMTTQLPNAPREIITAGWLDAMVDLPNTLKLVFDSNAGGVVPLHNFGEACQQKDFLLRKSLETTTLHEMLLTQTR